MIMVKNIFGWGGCIEQDKHKGNVQRDILWNDVLSALVWSVCRTIWYQGEENFHCPCFLQGNVLFHTVIVSTYKLFEKMTNKNDTTVIAELFQGQTSAEWFTG